MVRPLPAEARESIARIVQEYQPERILLFGSYAYGEPTGDSDVDLLVVKETPESPFDRALRLRRILRGVEHRVPIEFIVLTPEELEKRLAQGDPLMRLVTSRGVVLHAS